MTPRWCSRPATAAAATLAFVVAGVTGAAANFTTTTATSAEPVSTGILAAPAAVTATQSAVGPTLGVGTVHITWTGHAAPNGGPVDGYVIQRWSGATPAPACGSSPAAPLSAATSACDDTAVAFATSTYTVTALLKAWTATSGASAPVTVTAGPATNLAWTSVTVDTGSVSSCLFTCTWTGAGRSNHLTASVSVTDTYGNTVSTIGSGHTVTLTKTGGTLSTTSLPLPATGSATTTPFTFTTNGSNGWSTDTVSATSTGYVDGALTIVK